MKAILFTVLAAAAVYFAGNGSVQLWDRDEPRYAQCSRQMLESGDWVVPRLYDSLRAKKPPLIYWCQASAMKFLGRPGDANSFAFAARVPSAAAMLATLILLSIVLWRSSGPQQAAWTVFIFATSALAIVAAKICLTDSALILFITGAQCCFYAIWRGNRSWTVIIIMGVMFGLGSLMKGPFIFGIVACTAAALGVLHLIDEIIRRRKAVPRGLPVGTDTPRKLDDAANGDGSVAESSPSVANRSRMIAQVAVMLLIVVAFVAPWAILVNKRAPEFLPAMFLEGRQHAIGGKEGHTFPPGYHFLMVWPMFMPWSLLLPLGIGMGLHHRRLPQIRFALAAVLGPWIMVEFMGTKLPHYFLPAYPAMAFLVAFAIRGCMRGEHNDLHSRPFLIGAGFWATAVAAVGAVPWLAAGGFKLPGIGHIGADFRPLPLGAMSAISVGAVLLAAAVFFLFYTRRLVPAFVTMGVGMLAMISIIWTLYVPHADFLRLSIHAADVLKSHGATHPGDALMIDYKEPSLAFYQGGTIREADTNTNLMHKPFNEWPRWIVITRQGWDMLPRRYRDDSQPQHLTIIDSCRGWAYADQGRVVELLVVERCDDGHKTD